MTVSALMPFANLRGFDDLVKLHGITGATGDLRGGQPGYVPDDDRPAPTAADAVTGDAAAVGGAVAGGAATAEPDPAEPMSADLDAGALTPAPTGRAPLASHGRVGVERTQPVTANDIEAGQVRLPRPAKRLLPSKRCDVEVAVRGQPMRARWDPKTEGPKERSGVLRFGRRKLDGLVKPDEVLELRHERDGELQLR